MSGIRASDDLAEATAALHAQWALLREWVGDALEAHESNLPSVLHGWDVADLVAHLGRAMSALAVCQEAAAGTVPLTLAEYLGGYAGRAHQITEVTRQLAAEIADAPLPRVDALVAEAFTRLDAFGPGDRVVNARRAPVRLSDMVTSRVIELVVHADDLQRSLEHARRGSGFEGRADSLGLDGGVGDSPIHRDALDLVARALLRIDVARGGWSLEIAKPLTWVRLATGRLPYDVNVLAQALTPQFMSDSVPDLGRMLPIL